jgi:hypothetical protein
MLCALSILLIFKISNLLESILKTLHFAIINFIFIPITSYSTSIKWKTRRSIQLEMNIDINGKIIKYKKLSLLKTKVIGAIFLQVFLKV